MWVQSQEKYDQVADFDEQSGTLKEYSRQILGSQAPRIDKVAGWYSHASAGILLLYRKEGSIIFRAYNNEFVLDEKTHIEVFGPKEKRQLHVKHHNQVVFETEYELTQDGLHANDPTPFIEEEDFDFGLFVSNMSKNPKRKEVFLGLD